MPTGMVSPGKKPRRIAWTSAGGVDADVIDRDEAIAVADTLVVKIPSLGFAGGGSAVEDEGLLEEGAEEWGLKPGAGEEERGNERDNGDGLVRGGRDLKHTAEEHVGALRAQTGSQGGWGRQ